MEFWPLLCASLTGRPGAILLPSRASAPLMMPRKPFKGGNLDQFLKAGDAEKKYGPDRYAQVAQDAWKIQAKQTDQNLKKQQYMQSYEKQKAQILQDHIFIAALGAAAFWAFLSHTAAMSYAAGSGFGALYLKLKEREADSFGAQSLEEMKSGPPALVSPVLLVLIVAKYKSLLLLPALAGFFTSKLATFGQLLYIESD